MAAVGLEPKVENVEKTSELVEAIDQGGAESGALLTDPTSPVLSLLLKLTAGLTAEERTALAQLLGRSEGG